MNEVTSTPPPRGRGGAAAYLVLWTLACAVAVLGMDYSSHFPALTHEHKFAEHEMYRLYSRAAEIHAQTGRLPASLEEMLELAEDDYDREAFAADPWGTPYQWEIVPGVSPVRAWDEKGRVVTLRDGWPRIRSYGADGEPGGPPEGWDIVYPHGGYEKAMATPVEYLVSQQFRSAVVPALLFALISGAMSLIAAGWPDARVKSMGGWGCSALLFGLALVAASVQLLLVRVPSGH